MRARSGIVHTLLLAVYAAASACLLLAMSCSPNGASTPPEQATAEADRLRMSSPTSKVALLGPESGRAFRTPGRTCMLRGYLAEHPALPVRPALLRDGRMVPVLSFVMTVKITGSIITRGIATIRGHGKLRVFYDPEGIDSATITDWQSPPRGTEIEEDDIRLQADFRPESRNYWLRLQETAVATEPFEFRGREYRMPTGRSAHDLLRGEGSQRFGGLALASRSTLAMGSPASQLDDLFRAVKY